jgi:hypothetical protein
MSENINISLTPKEALVLWDILINISGKPSGTRGIADRILTKVGKHQDKYKEATVNLEKGEGGDEIHYLN